MYTKFILSVCTLFLTSLFFAQVASGKVTPHAKAERAIPYGTVEAYDKENRLVKSVLTDAEGNYTIQFKDTGMYTLKIKYAGFEDAVEEVNISSLEREKVNIEVKRDYTTKTRLLDEKSYAYRASGTKKVYGKRNFSGSKEGLTAGEINDFSKWELWTDLTKKELSLYQKAWRINPNERYVLQALNEEKSPLVGAQVQLISTKNSVVWETKTDNTGKAELWNSITNDSSEIEKIIILYKGKTKSIKKPKSFSQGINTVRLSVPCEANNTAEIAFVVDATGSMQDEINFIKRDLNQVIYNAKENFSDVNLRFASVFYRDHSETYLTKHKDFTSVLSEALVFIDEQDAAGGGDNPEAVDYALDVAVNQLSWSEDSRAKILFLILDAPAHNAPENIKKLQEIAQKAAQKGIKIIPVTGSGLQKTGEYLMRALALATNGTYVFLSNHSGIGESHIEPSTDEYTIDLLVNQLSTIIKHLLYYPSCEEETPTILENYPDSSISYARDSATNQEIPKTIEWNFYPNPTQGILNIEVSESVDFIYLTDITGKVLQQIDFSNYKRKQIELSDYPTGIYLLRYPIGKQWLTGKVVLTR